MHLNIANPLAFDFLEMYIHFMSSNTTKLAISHALKSLVQEKPLNKITIQNIADKCEINRQTFYHHFQDIIDLVEWTLFTDAEKLVKGNKTYDTWQKGYLAVFKTIENDKAFIQNVYHYAPREYIINYLYSITYQLLLNVVEEKSKTLNLEVRDSDKSFVANVFKFVFVGLIIEWIENDMQMPSEEIVAKLDSIIKGTMEQALNNAAIGKKNTL